MDIRGFLILLLYSVAAFTFLFMLAQPGEDLDLSLLESYLTALGDWSVDEMNLTKLILFILATVFNLVIMLNLLISIIGETFGRV